MCWGAPAKVVDVSGYTALVDFGGVRREVLVGVAELSPDDLVMVHAGVVIGKLTREEFLANVALYRDIRVQEFTDAGLEKTAAMERATAETNKLLESLGVHESIASIGLKAKKSSRRS